MVIFSGSLNVIEPSDPSYSPRESILTASDGCFNKITFDSTKSGFFPTEKYVFGALPDG